MTYVLRRFNPIKASSGLPSKYLTMEGFKKVVNEMGYNQNKLHDIVSMVRSKSHVKQLKNLHYNPKRDIPLHITVQETDDPIGSLCH